MPTMVIFKGERNLDELTTRLFKAGGEPQARKQAADALLKANPPFGRIGHRRSRYRHSSECR